MKFTKLVHTLFPPVSSLALALHASRFSKHIFMLSFPYNVRWVVGQVLGKFLLRLYEAPVSQKL